MRAWIRTILDNEGLYADFIDYTEEMERKLSRKVQDYVAESEFTKAQQIVAEINVYKTMRKGFTTERQEIISRQKHSNKE
jgi:hypothetical protein